MSVIFCSRQSRWTQPASPVTPVSTLASDTEGSENDTVQEPSDELTRK